MRLCQCVFIFLMIFSCASRVQKAVRDVKYSAWEKLGYEKRDLFKKEVSNVKDEQEENGEAFKDALTQLKEVYAFDGGNLEREYDKLNSSYVDAKDQAESASQSITKLHTVAEDLFSEWEKELGEIQDGGLRSQSSKQLSQTRTRYSSLHQRLKKTEMKMGPVLQKLKDQVLFLKHNLNAAAIAGLKSEGQRIETDIGRLIKEMNQASEEADKFIKTL